MSARHTLLARLRNRLETERALRNWRRSLVPLRVEQAPAPTRTVLFCDLMTMTATAKVESLMAALLRLKGYRVVVLLERPDWALEAIFRAAAPEAEFIYRSSAISTQDLEEAQRLAERIMADAPNLQSVVELQIDGYRIGRNVQSWVVRQFRVGRLDDADIRHRAATLETLAKSLATKAFVQKLLKDYEPDAAIFVERGYTPAGEVFDGCVLASVDVVQWCGAPQSDCLIYKRYQVASRGEHPLALSDEMWRQLQDMPWCAADDQGVIDRIAANYASGAWYNRQQLQEGKMLLTPDQVRTSLGLDASKKTAVIFTHILYDATFFYGESLFEDYEEWLIETVRAAIANPRLNWVVKVHPVNVWRSRVDGAELVQLEADALRKEFGALPSYVKLMPADTEVNTFSLFDVADYGLTVRGTIGMELPCFGIPVVTAGTGRYSGRGFTLDPKTRDEYRTLLGRLDQIPRLDDVAIRRARLHYHGALYLRPVPMKSFVLDFHSGKGSPQRQNVHLKRRADEGLLQTEDLGRLVNWLTDRRTPELLARDI
jgi:hypothetical protein